MTTELFGNRSSTCCCLNSRHAPLIILLSSRIWNVELHKAVACITALPSKRAPSHACFAADKYSPSLRVPRFCIAPLNPCCHSDHTLYVASGRRLLMFDRRCGSVVMKVSFAPTHQHLKSLKILSLAGCRGDVVCKARQYFLYRRRCKSDRMR